MREVEAALRAENAKLRDEIRSLKDPNAWWADKYACYLNPCAYPGLGKEYRCDDEKGFGFPSHCACPCHKSQPESLEGR